MLMRALVRGPRLTRGLFALTWCVASSLLVATPTDAARSSRHAHVAGKRAHASGKASLSHRKHAKASKTKQRKAARGVASRSASAPYDASAPKSSASGELSVIQDAIGLARKGKLAEANALA
jgi:hypothetical protein